MKLVAEIPEELKRAVDNNEEYRLYTESVGHVMLTAIKNGKPLDAILDEIKAMIESREMIETTSERGFYNMALNDVLQIIDKYKEGENR